MSDVELHEDCLFFPLEGKDLHRFCTLSDLDKKLCVACRKRGEWVMATTSVERSAETK